MLNTGQNILKYTIIFITLVYLSACSTLDKAADDILGRNTSTKPNTDQVYYPNNIEDAQNNKIGQITTKQYKIALFLPVKSGSIAIKKAAISLLNAARLANDEIKNPNMNLLVYPTDGTNNTIIPAAKRAVQDQIDLIIGPLLSPSVVAAKKYSEPAGIPMIAFSNNQASVNGGFSYLLSYLPEQNVSNIVSYALSQGHTNFGLFASNTPYGKRVGDTFIQNVHESGSKITNAVFFTENTADFYEKTKAVTEVELRSSPNTPTSWTSIMLPDRASVMMQVMPLFRNYEIDFKNTLFLGSGIWHDPRILEIEELDGAVFAAPNQKTMQVFEDRYQAAFKEKPTQIASLAYDAVGLASGLIRQYPNNPFDINNITNPNGFSGVGGIFRFKNNGLSERGLSILKIENKQFKLAVPAPNTFSGS